ncbi:MAG: triose-phosphate isomerase [Deltaproteobacteria bacterium]|nr:triose-phosphate isomerase [Deltaproteobacteria bacterium]
MRKPFIAGNWKMNLASKAAAELAGRLLAKVSDFEGIEVAVAPTATSLAAVIEVLRGSPIEVAAQNCYWEESGAFTGELSTEMIKEIGCSHVIIGHSERRQFFAETDETVNKKLQAAYRAGLMPIVCIGESLGHRESGRTMEVVAGQLKGALKDISVEQMQQLTVAYEPIWAIGTGKTATPDQAQEVHAFLRGQLMEMFGQNVADVVRIQYGGSVKPSNAKELMDKPDIDGALVGGASLKADDFIGILGYRN